MRGLRLANLDALVRVALILLLLASAVIFVVGTSIERGRSGEAKHENTVSSTEGTAESSGEGSTAESHPASAERSGSCEGIVALRSSAFGLGGLMRRSPDVHRSMAISQRTSGLPRGCVPLGGLRRGQPGYLR